jgi:hypothetical protein
MACSDDGAPTAMTGTVRVAISDEQVELIKSPHPGLLVISSGLFVLAAAAFSSKEGDGAGTPLTLLGLFVLIAYAASRKASVTFILDSGAAVTVTGSVTEAIALVALVELAQQSGWRKGGCGAEPIRDPFIT